MRYSVVAVIVSILVCDYVRLLHWSRQLVALFNSVEPSDIRKRANSSRPDLYTGC